MAESTSQTLESMPELRPERGAVANGDDGNGNGDGDGDELDWEDDDGVAKLDTEELKVYPKTLSLQDVDACCVLEDLAFPPEQRCSREKFIYRLSKCPELSLGLFTTSAEDYFPKHLSAPTAATSHAVESSSPRKQILLAHAIGTLSSNSTVTDADMTLPATWDPSSPEYAPHSSTSQEPSRSNSPSSSSSSPPGKKIGHDIKGKTVCLHSLAVLPSYQGKRLGSTLLQGYIQRLAQSENYDSVALIADASHVAYYESRGFENLGQSSAAFGGVQWNDMVLGLENVPTE